MARHRRPTRSRLTNWFHPARGTPGHPLPAPEPDSTHTVQLLYPDGSTLRAQWARGASLGEIIARVPLSAVCVVPAAIRIDQRTLIAVLPQREAS